MSVPCVCAYQRAWHLWPWLIGDMELPDQERHSAFQSVNGTKVFQSRLVWILPVVAPRHEALSHLCMRADHEEKFQPVWNGLLPPLAKALHIGRKEGSNYCLPQTSNPKMLLLPLPWQSVPYPAIGVGRCWQLVGGGGEIDIIMHACMHARKFLQSHPVEATPIWQYFAARPKLTRVSWLYEAIEANFVATNSFNEDLCYIN